jgi:hypothetical protein
VIRLQANKYGYVYCPQYFRYDSAADTGSGYHHGIFPPTNDERRLCVSKFAVAKIDILRNVALQWKETTTKAMLSVC